MARKPPIDLLWEKWCLHIFSVALNPILLILAGNKGMHKISDEFQFRPDRTTDNGVSSPSASKKQKIPMELLWENGVSMLARSFLIEPSSKLMVIGTGIKARSSLTLGRMRNLILELLALE